MLLLLFYFQTTVQKLLQLCRQHDYLNQVTEKYAVIEGCLKTCMEHGNSVKNSQKLQDDFYFSCFHPVNHYSFEVISTLFYYCIWPRGKESIDARITQERKVKTLTKNWRDLHRKGTRKLSRNILMVTAVFLNQKRVNICEHLTENASLESFWKVLPGGCEMNGYREI